MKEHLVTLETTPGAVANLINEIIEEQGPFEFPHQGNFGEEILIIGYPNVSGDGSFFVLDFDARNFEADYPSEGDHIGNIIRISIYPLGENQSQVLAQTKFEILEGFLERLIFKLNEIFDTTPSHQSAESEIAMKMGGRPPKEEYDKIFSYLNQGFSLPHAMSEVGMDPTDPNELDKVKKAIRYRRNKENKH